MKTILLVAGGVAYGRLTGQRDDDGQQTGSITNTLSPELQRITSGLAEAARGVVSASASKGVDMLNQNLQNRSTALRENIGSTSQDQQDESQSDAESSDESEASDEQNQSGGE